MTGSKVLNILSWVFAVLLAILFGLAAFAKLSGASNTMFAGWGYPAWFAIFIGIAELAGAVGLLIPRLLKLAVLGLTIIMIGAAYTHFANGEGLAILRPVIFTVFLWLTWFFRGSGETADA